MLATYLTRRILKHSQKEIAKHFFGEWVFNSQFPILNSHLIAGVQVLTWIAQTKVWTPDIFGFLFAAKVFLCTKNFSREINFPRHWV
jgi:hypothetical protein